MGALHRVFRGVRVDGIVELLLALFELRLFD